MYKKKLALESAVRNVVANPSPTSDQLLEGYVREALRHDPVTPGVVRTATSAQSLKKDFTWAKGDNLFFDYRAAGLQFPVPAGEDPEHYVDPNFELDKYQDIQGDGVFKVLGQEFVYGVAVSVLKAVFSLKNVKRTPGPAGTLRRYVLKLLFTKW